MTEKQPEKVKAAGEPFVWFTSMGLTIGLVMVVCLLSLIAVDGIEVFWPRTPSYADGWRYIQVVGLPQLWRRTELMASPQTC